MSVPAPTGSRAAARAWDKCELGPFTLPGFCTVTVKVSDEISKAKAKGASGASTTFQGSNLGTVKVVCSMPDEIEAGTLDYEVAQRLLTELNARRGKEKTYSIVHPMTTLFGIAKVTVESITGELKGREFVLTFELSEFNPSKKGAPSETRTSKTLDPRNQSLAPDLPNVTPRARPTALP